ncbi:MAG: hypothetical protein LBF84_03655 [Holosporales bacterium]|jgi:hypothetical protein|nr:hypothetical protein [Holosporales bacterium]
MQGQLGLEKAEPAGTDGLVVVMMLRESDEERRGPVIRFESKETVKEA